MATKFEFYLSEGDTERLFAIKEEEGKDQLTGNEYAKELLHKILYKMHPETVQYNEETGERIRRNWKYGIYYIIISSID